jgi:putative salt-induced outer membrane protein YdiY
MSAETAAARRATRHSARGARRLPALSLVALAVIATSAWSAPKTDVVELVNGDRITGEIKSLEYNQLKLSTDNLGTVYIEWDKVARVTSNQELLLETADGGRSAGHLVGGGTAGTFMLKTAGDDESVQSFAMGDVVRVTPLQGGDFIDRLDGYASVGLDFTRASDRRNVDVSAGLSSTTRIRKWSLDGSVNLTDDSAGELSERYDLQAVWRRFLQDRDFFYQGFGGLSRNSELDLRLRTLAGGAYGKHFVRSNRAVWLGGIGLAYSHEKYTGDNVLDSVEAVLVTEFSVFRYDFPATDIGGKLMLLPSLTESGRYRAEADLRAKYEFVDNLYFQLEVYGSYDSKPPGLGAVSSDYGLTTSLGYSF